MHPYLQRFYGKLSFNFLYIYCSRAQCQEQVKGYPGAQFKKFSSQEEAESFIHGSGGPEILPVLPRGAQSIKPYESQKKIQNSFSSTGCQSAPAASSSGFQSGSYYAVAKGKNVGVYSTW